MSGGYLPKGGARIKLQQATLVPAYWVWHSSPARWAALWTLSMQLLCRTYEDTFHNMLQPTANLNTRILTIVYHLWLNISQQQYFSPPRTILQPLSGFWSVIVRLLMKLCFLLFSATFRWCLLVSADKRGQAQEDTIMPDFFIYFDTWTNEAFSTIQQESTASCNCEEVHVSIDGYWLECDEM